MGTKAIPPRCDPVVVHCTCDWGCDLSPGTVRLADGSSLDYERIYATNGTFQFLGAKKGEPVGPLIYPVVDGRLRAITGYDWERVELPGGKTVPNFHLERRRQSERWNRYEQQLRNAQDFVTDGRGKAERVLRGLSASEVARAIGVTLGTVRSGEEGKTQSPSWALRYVKFVCGSAK